MIKVRNIILLVPILLSIGCMKEIKDGPSLQPTNFIKRDLDKIKKKGKLIALTGYNAYSYFIYRGQPMGYEYELLQRLAGDLELDLQIKVIPELDQMVSALNSGKGDLIAFNLTVTKSRTKELSFTEHHTLTPQVLVQRKPDSWRKMKLHQIKKHLVRSPIDLIDREIYVTPASSYVERLKHLSEELGVDLKVIEADSENTTEELIAKVAEGELSLTVSDKNIAELYLGYYPIIDIDYEISLPQRIAWAVRKNSPKLLSAVNDWLEREKKRNDYYTIYDRYFESTKDFKRRLESEYFSLTGSKISQYDDLIKEYALTLNWDWRLLAAIIYQESQFKPNRTSWAGAKGLMQLMPATAKRFGVEDATDAKSNLRAGVKYLQWLDGYWSDEILDNTERLKFVLASYNIGPGHIKDSRSLAIKYGGSPNVWFDNVEAYLLKKSEAKYYKDDVVLLGYAKGKETVKYVSEILDRYDQYKRLINK